ncbi:MAG: hypothetical protein ACUVUG_07195 [Candidatus Aminicenantia bacterium]
MKLYSEGLINELEKKIVELKQISEKLVKICENTNNLFFSLDEEGNFTEVNCVIELFSYKKKMLLEGIS